MKRLMLLMLLLCLYSFVSATDDTYYGSVNRVVDQFTSSVCVNCFLVGQSTVSFTLNNYDKVVGIYNDDNYNTLDFFYSPLQSVTTWYQVLASTHMAQSWAQGNPVRVQPGEIIYPTFRGTLYFINDGLNKSSSTVVIIRERKP